jgi:hypothetical protein
MIIERTQEGKAITKKKYSPKQLDHAIDILKDNIYNFAVFV